MVWVLGGTARFLHRADPAVDFSMWTYPENLKLSYLP
jgi:hypothetical protein